MSDASSSVFVGAGTASTLGVPHGPSAASIELSASSCASSPADPSLPPCATPCVNEQPPSARGEAVFNFGGFGHSLSYERFPNGKTYIFDSQKGKGYDLTSEKDYRSFLDKWGYENVRDVQITRLDNLELDHTFLSRWATNSSGKAPSSSSSRRNTSTRPKNMSEEMWKLFQKARV